jgi:small-conductance mechanosensitive channel
MRRIPIFITLFIFVISLMAITTGIAFAQTDTPDTSLEDTPAPPTSPPDAGKTESPESQSTPTPESQLTPTATPLAVTVEDEGQTYSPLFTIEGPLQERIADFAARTGLDQYTFLGLTGEDWLNLAVSIVFFILFYLLGRWLLFRVLRRALKRTKYKFDEILLENLRPQLNWLVLVFGLQLSLARLVFLSQSFRILLNQAFFIAYLTIIAIILWKLISLGSDALLRHDRTEEDIQRLQPIYMVFRRIAEALLLVGYGSIVLTYFGVDITAFAASLGIAGLAISLAAQDTLADAIAGFLILLDQPFRVGDRIEITGLGTWGDVVEIGTRSTRIRTRDNRLVIVPNSAIAKDQVVNYSYPDPRYRVQIEVGIDYDSDLKLAREAAIEAVKGVEGVLLDKPIDALFVDFGESTITFRIRWWIDSYIDTRRMFDKVNEALLKGFKDANINMPNMTYDVNLKVDDQDVKHFAPATREDRAQENSEEAPDQE